MSSVVGKEQAEEVAFTKNHNKSDNKNTSNEANNNNSNNNNNNNNSNFPSTPILRLRRRRTVEIESIPPPVTSVSFLCGLAAGILQAGLFNPYDRALYLSIKNNVPFLRWENFVHPYQGFFQSVGHRALSGGLYYPLEHFFLRFLVSSQGTTNCIRTNNDEDEHATTIRVLQSGTMTNFVAGTAAGAANALVVNPIAAIKYKTWGRDTNQGMIQEMVGMLQKGGYRPFINGLLPTVLRDLVFGGCYTFVRLELQDPNKFHYLSFPDSQWQANMVAAALATIVSGPFNLARNIQYSTRSQQSALSIVQVFQNLVYATSQQPTMFKQIKYLQYQLRLGWGTIRVAVGMAFGHAVYDNLHCMYEDSVRWKTFA